MTTLMVVSNEPAPSALAFIPDLFSISPAMRWCVFVRATCYRRSWHRSLPCRQCGPAVRCTVGSHGQRFRDLPAASRAGRGFVSKGKARSQSVSWRIDGGYALASRPAPRLPGPTTVDSLWAGRASGLYPLPSVLSRSKTLPAAHAPCLNRNPGRGARHPAAYFASRVVHRELLVDKRHRRNPLAVPDNLHMTSAGSSRCLPRCAFGPPRSLGAPARDPALSSSWSERVISLPERPLFWRAQVRALPL